MLVTLGTNRVKKRQRLIRGILGLISAAFAYSTCSYKKLTSVSKE